MRKKVLIFLALLLFGSSVFFAVKLVPILMEYRRGSEKYESLTESFVQEESVKETQEEDKAEAESEAVPIKVSFAELKAQYPDAVAWLYNPDNPINYPVLQAEDNDFYLRKAPDGSYNYGGSIFLDAANSSDFSDWNNILYGHNMKDGSMFGSLLRYKTQEYYDKHPFMYLLTEDKNYKVELIGDYETAADSCVYDFPSSVEERNNLISKLKQQSSFKSQVEIDDTDRLLTLSTCVYDYEGARYVLLGVLKELK